MPFDVEVSLPTLDKFNATVPGDLDANKVAHQWFDKFASLVENHDANGVADLFVEDSVWRDILALTWDFRTFVGKPKIKQFLQDRLAVAKAQNFKLNDAGLGLHKPYPDVAWIQGSFGFETDTGLASGILRLIPTANGDWKAHALFTNLEDLKGHPEKLGELRNREPNHGHWEADRRREVAYEGRDPTVLIVGGGQSGLEVAARLKCLGIDALIVERNARIGDNWRNRYDALCLHDPGMIICPIYRKQHSIEDHISVAECLTKVPANMACVHAIEKTNWLESYAEILELNVWTSTSVERVTKDVSSGQWLVTVKNADGAERNFKPKHIVFASGLGKEARKYPEYPGMDEFQGQILHSTQHKKATDHAGKKVFVVGACTSAHDICTDYYHNGIDVTMFQRSSTYIVTTKSLFKHMLSGLYSETSPPTDIADRMNASISNVQTAGMAKRMVRIAAEEDEATLEGLNKVGFKTNLGYKDAGLFLLAWDRGGGYYIDVGASQLIIDGKIKLKSGTQIERFTKTGIKFADGSEVVTDVVLFATGFEDARRAMLGVTDTEVSNQIGQVGGLNEEGEINGAWRDLGIPNLWFMMGNLALCRFHSKHLALQIKAIEEGLFGTRYSCRM